MCECANVSVYVRVFAFAVVCVCVCERERERERESAWGRMKVINRFKSECEGQDQRSGRGPGYACISPADKILWRHMTPSNMPTGGWGGGMDWGV